MSEILRRTLSRCSVSYSTVTILKRMLLTTSYGQQEKMKQFLDRRKSEVSGQALSSICLLIDRCSEKGFPFSSLTADSMVNAIEDRDDIASSMYYLHKLRHCDSCYFLRPWTVHVWFGKCLEHGALDLALGALNEKSQYGAFPDEMMYNFLIDKCVKDKDIELALKFALYAFMAECLNSELTQLVCLHVILKVMEKHNSVSPNFESVPERRNFFALCFRLGQLLDIDNLKVLGLVELGSIEKDYGIRAIYQHPWCPILWTEGYSKNASSILKGDVTLTRDVLDHVNESLGSENLGVTVVGESLVKSLKSQYERLSHSENSAINAFGETVSSWVRQHDKLVQIERDIAEEKLQQRQEYFEEKRLLALSKRMAVEKLGYWEFMTEDVVDNDGLENHLRTDYIQGSSSDIEIESRIAADTH